MTPFKTRLKSSALCVAVALLAPCYLVTNKRIDEIPCDLRAATTDALRYKARGLEPVGGGGNEPQQVKRNDVSQLRDFAERRRQLRVKRPE